MKSQLFKSCPVCDMAIDRQIPVFSYLGIEYQFCSRQCLDNFKQHPHLYIGRPGGHLSAKRSQHCVKKYFSLTKPVDTNFYDVKTALQSMMGIEKIELIDNELQIEYDLIQVSLQEIFERLAQIGLWKKIGWWQRLKIRHRFFTERNQRDNLEDDGRFSGKCH